MKHNPGPWKCDSASFTDDNDLVNYAIRAKGMVISAGNAHLIAAAPTMAEFLIKLFDKNLIYVNGQVEGITSDDVNDARAIIKQLRGES